MGTERRQLRGPLSRGVLAGALYGAFQGFTEGSLLAGVISGLFFAAAMTVTFYWLRSAGEHLAGLSYRQKRAVMRSVRRGEPVSDPNLAGPTIRHAQRVQASVGGQRFGVVLGRALLAVSVLGLGLALLVRSTAGGAAAGFSLAVWTLILVVGPPLEQRKTANARAAEAAASRLVTLPEATLGPSPGHDSSLTAWAAPKASPGLIRSGLALLGRRRWHWLALTHIGLAAVLVMYFLMVLANTAGFSYSFWNEPAPNDAADRFAVLSLLALAVSVVLVGYGVYGAYCVMFLDACHGGTASALTVLRRTVGPALRSWWWGPPLYFAAAASVVLVMPAVVAVPVLAPVPFSVILARQPPGVGGHFALARSTYARLLPVSIITAIGGFAVSQGFWWSFALVERFDGLIELLVLPISWACYLILALVAALAAACTAVLVTDPPAAPAAP